MSAVEWIAQRRELLDAATEGPWFQDAYDPGIVRGEQRSDGDGYWSLFASETGHDAEAVPSDAAFISDARTSLPLALDALEAVLEPHQKRSGGGKTWCHYCGADWPCPPVAAAESALGVTS